MEKMCQFFANISIEKPFQQNCMVHVSAISVNNTQKQVFARRQAIEFNTTLPAQLNFKNATV